MSKKTKTYRGQRKIFNGCGCFYCTGYDKSYIQRIKERHLDQETYDCIHTIEQEYYPCALCIYVDSSYPNSPCIECDDGDKFEIK